MTRDGELSATDFVTLVLSGIGTETDAFGVSRIPSYAAQAANSYSAPAEPRRPARDVGAGAARAAGGRGGRQRPPADVRPGVRRRRAQRAGARRPRGAARRLARPSTGLAVDTDLRWTMLTGARPEGSRRRRPDRRGARARQHDLGPGARRRGARRPPHRRGQGRGVGDRDGPRRRRQRDPAQRGPRVPVLRPGRGAGAVRRAATSPPPTPSGRTRAPSAPRRRWSTSSRSSSPARSCSTGSTPGSRRSPANPAAKRYVREGRADVARALAAQEKDAAGLSPRRVGAVCQGAPGRRGQTAPTGAPCQPLRRLGAVSPRAACSAGGRARRASRCRA